MPTPYYTAAEVASVLRLTQWQVTVLCRTGALRATRPGRAWLISEGDLDDYLARRSNQSAQDAS